MSQIFHCFSSFRYKWTRRKRKYAKSFKCPFSCIFNTLASSERRDQVDGDGLDDVKHSTFNFSSTEVRKGARGEWKDKKWLLSSTGSDFTNSESKAIYNSESSESRHGVKHKNLPWATYWLWERGKHTFRLSVQHTLFFIIFFGRCSLFPCFWYTADIERLGKGKGWEGEGKNSAHARNLRIEEFKFNLTAFCEPFREWVD